MMEIDHHESQRYFSSSSSFCVLTTFSLLGFFFRITFYISLRPLGFSFCAILRFFSCSCCFFSSSLLFSFCLCQQFYLFCLFFISLSISGMREGWIYLRCCICPRSFDMSPQISVICFFIQDYPPISQTSWALLGSTCLQMWKIRPPIFYTSRFSLSKTSIRLLFAFLSSLSLWQS